MGVFGDNALACFNAGLIPLPIRTDKKKVPAVKGYHGYTANVPTRSNVIYWTSQFPDHNIAIRLPPFIVGIDVDAYDDKKGAQTLAKLESELGLLPKTIISTSRNDGISGIRLFRLPPAYEGRKFIGTIPGNVDILHWGNRYAIIEPSIHPTGRPYRWVRPDEDDGPRLPLAGPESAADGPQWWPRWDSLPTLPEAWCERILAPERIPSEVLAEYAPKFKQGDGTPAGLAVLRKEITVDWPESRDKNGWNNSLFVSAKRIAELIAGGELEFSAARKSLLEMALTADPDMEGVEATIDSGFYAGLQSPRTLQAREDYALPDGYRSTDVGNAQRLYKLIKGKAHFVLKWGEWIVYENGVWAIDDDQVRMFGLAKQVTRNLYMLAAKHSSNADLHKTILKHAHQSESVAGLGALIRATRDLCYISHEALDQYPEILNVQNGEINLRTGELHPHDPTHLLTVQTAVIYDPDAPAPVFLKALSRWQPDVEVRSYLQKVCGSGLIGKVIEHFFVNYGLGQNGKSKFYGSIQHVLGPYYTVPNKALIVRTTHEPHPTIKASLFGKRFVVAAETEKTDRLSEASIKDLTGSDLITARRMREDEWKFEYTHTLFLHTNYKPQIHDSGIGMWRRIRVIPWNETIPDSERDPFLLDKLYSESSGILNWLIAGAKMFLDYGLDNEPTAVIRATAEYKSESNEFMQFLDKCVMQGVEGKVKPAELYQAYVKWAKNEGRPAISSNAFGREMTSLNLSRKLISGTNYFNNMRIISSGIF